MTINDINLRIRDLENDFTNGSSVIALNGLKIFVDAVKLYANSENFYQQIYEIKENIIQTKPAMSSLKNIINKAFKEILSLKNINSEEIYKDIISKINLAKKNTIKETINNISNIKFDKIITCSYSSAIINLFYELKNKKYDFEISILQTIWKGINYSVNLQKECDKLKIKSKIVKKEKIPICNFAIIGADSIVKSQGVINGIPSKFLAINSYNKKIPFYVIGESYKNTDKIIIEDGFEFIENQYISAIFSDKVFV